jgi:hypothetical protein
MIEYNDMKKTFDKYIGWFGLVLLLINQSLLAMGYAKSFYSPEAFLVINLIGSMAIAYVSHLKKAYEPMMLNLIIIVITILGYIFQKV